jgi:hypothetical protein
MKKLSLVFASMFLFAGITFAYQAKQADKKETKKTTASKKSTDSKGKTKTATKKADKK